MTESPYWSNNWFAQQELRRRLNGLRDKVQEAREESGADLRTVLGAIDQLEVDIGRALLKVHAITEILQEKGLVNEDELAEKAGELDLLDGDEDGILHPSVFRTEEEAQRAPSPRAFLISLEDKTLNPREFLGLLQDDGPAEAGEESADSPEENQDE